MIIAFVTGDQSYSFLSVPAAWKLPMCIAAGKRI